MYTEKTTNEEVECNFKTKFTIRKKEKRNLCKSNITLL